MADSDETDSTDDDGGPSEGPDGDEVVEDEPDHGNVDEPDDDARDEPDDEGADVAAPDHRDGSPTLTRDDLGGGRRLPDRLGPLVLGGIALLMVGFIVGRVSADDDIDEPPTTTIAPVGFPTGDQDRSGYWGFGGVTPAQSDAFDRDDSPSRLGATDTGQQWTAVAGTWGTEGGRARVAPGAGPAYAVVRGGPAERLTEATLMTVEPGAGIAFRFRGPDDHFALTVVPTRGVWELHKIVGGRRSLLAEIPGPVSDGTTVTVAQRGAELQVLFDGVEASRVSDPALRTEASSGLVAGADRADTARWDRFYVGAMPA